jgi:hypothetical protein
LSVCADAAVHNTAATVRHAAPGQVKRRMLCISRVLGNRQGLELIVSFALGAGKPHRR